MAQPPAAATVAAGANANAAAPTGCCNITFDDGTGQQFEHITEEDCRQRAMNLRGAAQWVQGECA